MKSLIIFLHLVLGAAANADISKPLDMQHLQEEGRLLSVQITIGEPIRIFVVGKEEAKLDLRDLTLTVRQLKPYPPRVLSVAKEGGGYFSVTESMLPKKPTDLEVRTSIKGNVETFHFKLDNEKR